MTDEQRRQLDLATVILRDEGYREVYGGLEAEQFFRAAREIDTALEIARKCQEPENVLGRMSAGGRQKRRRS